MDIEILFYFNPSFVFQDNFLKEIWNNENSSVLDAYQPVFLIALSSYREYNTFSSFVMDIHEKLKGNPSGSFLSSQSGITQNEVSFSTFSRNITSKYRHNKLAQRNPDHLFPSFNLLFMLSNLQCEKHFV